MSARLCAWVLALTLAAASARAAGMPAYGTKNFTPGSATPSYFTGERYIPYDGWQGPAPAAYGVPRALTAAAPTGGQSDLYARPPEPAQRDIAHRRRSRPVYARSRSVRTRAEAVRVPRLRRAQVRHRVRLARARVKRTWRR